MDNFKTLFEKGEYELVIKATRNSTDVDDLFYCLSAFLALNQIKEALTFIEEKKNILKLRLPMLMKTHIELLCLEKRYDEAYEKIIYYRELPYFSQEAEETIKELPSIVREYEKNASKIHYYDEEALTKALLSNDSYTVLGALDALRDREISKYYLYITRIMTTFPKQSVRSFALLFLVQRSVDKEFSFLHIDKMITVNPSKLHPPFVGESFDKIKERMQEQYRDTSLSQTAIQLLSSYLIYIYPDEIDLEDDAIIEAFKIVASKYLGIKYVSLKQEELQELINHINQALENF